MNKDYWHSAGSGALGLSGPWNSTAQWKVRKSRPALRWAGQAAQMGAMLAFVTGAVIAGYRNWLQGVPSPRETATFAYQSVGQIMDEIITRVTDMVALGSHADAIRDNVLFYLEIPFQICAFAGAYVASDGIQYLDHILAMVPTHF